MTQATGNSIVVSVDAVPPKARDYLSTRKRYPAKPIFDEDNRLIPNAYKIVADHQKEITINPASDRHHLNGMAWNVEVVA